ncbi:TonB-dependent receptor plug domain-containing protein [Roseateles sp. BYS180W]|uniref:TonB-dependent receptor plug domain-containing protein n=1 Tax=Roseateles rivi TaxID=3299028 RepID=A0ABW7FWW9_9BURK
MSPNAEKLERVVVTGTNIKRLAVGSETASPVQTINRDDIRRSGATTVRQILDTLTAATPGELRDDGNNGSFAAGATGVSMRGLGKGATLVLLNGRRAAYYALADGAKEQFLNIDSIPADAVERIETLKDGASAIYGSDAMAGVINIITRSTFEGVTVSASNVWNDGPSAGGSSTVAVVGGLGNLNKDRYNVFANLEAFERRGYTLADVIHDAPEYQTKIFNPNFGAPSLFSYPGNLQVGSRREPVKGCTTLNSAGLCVNDLNGLNQWSDPAKRLNFYSSARFQATDDLQLFGEVHYSKTETDYRSLPFAIAAGSPSRWYDGYNKKAQEVAQPLLAIGNPANPYPQKVGINYRFTDNVNGRESTASADQYRVLVGAQGVFAGYDYQVALGRNASSADKLDHVRPSRDMIAAVESGEYKIGQVNSPELLARIFPEAGILGDTYQNFADGKISGDLFKLPGGMAQFAAGGEFRTENVNIRSTDNIMRADIIGRGAQLTVGDRKLAGAFFEVNAPVVKNLELNGALRFDKASGFDGHWSPKLGVRWEVMPKLLLRGTVAGGFRAPNIPETLGQVGVTGFFNSMVDPKRCDTATKIRDILKTGNAADQSDATSAYNSGCLASLPTMISSNPKLKPETSSSFTLGMVFEVNRNLGVALDYFNIERKNEISYRDPDFVLEREGKPGYEGAISRGSVTEQDKRFADRANALRPGANVAWDAGSITALLLQYENFGKTQTSGIDFDINGRTSAGSFGNLAVGLTATYALIYRTWDVDANIWRPNTIGLRDQPRLRLRLATGWSKDDWSAGLNFIYTSATKLNDTEADFGTWGEAACQKRLNPGDLPCFIQSDLRTDLNLGYTGIKNLRLSLNVNNLMGEKAQVNLRSGYSVRPRVWRLGASYTF